MEGAAQQHSCRLMTKGFKLQDLLSLRACCLLLLHLHALARSSHTFDTTTLFLSPIVSSAMHSSKGSSNAQLTAYYASASGQPILATPSQVSRRPRRSRDFFRRGIPTSSNRQSGRPRSRTLSQWFSGHLRLTSPHGGSGAPGYC